MVLLSANTFYIVPLSKKKLERFKVKNKEVLAYFVGYTYNIYWSSK